MSYQKLLGQAFEMLSRRNHCSAELRKKLVNKNGENEEIDKVIARLEELNYLDDEKFIEEWLASRARFKPRGIMMLKQELYKRGVDKDLIADNVTEETVDEFANAMDLLEKYSRKFTKLSENEKKEKICRMLRSKGFKGETIYRALESW